MAKVLIIQCGTNEEEDKGSNWLVMGLGNGALWT